ncbi:inner centromere protein-like [Bolinopsis microptera]|uniref:inner centromere protein-like n=1 Tax=Bolinopsis microptera TaxID=2820187 RepID=UPI00307A8C55
MPRKRDSNSVMKPRKHSNRLNVSLIFSSGDTDDFKSEQDFSDALSSCSRSTANTDTLRSGVSYISEGPYSPSLPPTPTTPRTQAWDTRCSSDRSESIYDSLIPRKESISEISIISASSDNSSLFLKNPSDLDPTTPTNLHTQHKPALDWETTENMKLKMKNKNKNTPEVMKPQRIEQPTDQSESPFSKLQRASMKKRKNRKNSEDLTVMTPRRDHLNSSPGDTPPGSRHNSLSRSDELITPCKTRTNSGSSRNSEEFKSRTLPRRMPDNMKVEQPKVLRSTSEMPTAPPRTVSRTSSSRTSSSDSKTRTLERPGKQSRQSRPNSIMETSTNPVPIINVPNGDKHDRKSSIDAPPSPRGTLKRNGTLKKKKKVQKEETPKKKKAESLENLKKDGTPKKTKSETLAKLKKLTPKKLKSASLENLKKDGTLKKQKSESIENLKKDEALKKQTSESIENLKEKEPAKKEERVRLEALLAKKQELLEREPEKKEELPLIMKPNFNVENEKENDINLVNEQIPDRREDEEEEEEVAHFIKRCDSKVIYNDFEEMEALLMEQERLVDNLEQERQEKEELERIKTEQEKQQVEMQDTIKILEEEIVTVDCQMVKLSMKVADEDQYDELEDQKRSLHAKLIQERGKVRQMDDLISLSGMSVYSENGLMLNQDISDYSKRELLDQIKNLKKEKTELETTIKQFRCDGANEKRKQDKVIKDLMTQIRGFHNVPVKRQDSSGLQETMAMITDLRSQLEQMKSQNLSQTKLIERLVTERNQHLVEMARLKGNVEESIHLKEEVS